MRVSNWFVVDGALRQFNRGSHQPIRDRYYKNFIKFANHWIAILIFLDESGPEDDLYLSDLAGYNPDFRKNSYDLGKYTNNFYLLKLF